MPRRQTHSGGGPFPLLSNRRRRRRRRRRRGLEILESAVIVRRGKGKFSCLALILLILLKQQTMPKAKEKTARVNDRGRGKAKVELKVFGLIEAQRFLGRVIFFFEGMEGRIQAIVTSQRRLSSKTFTHASLLSVLSGTPRPKKAGQKKKKKKAGSPKR